LPILILLLLLIAIGLFLYWKKPGSANLHPSAARISNLRSIKDPRDAALALMLAMAKIKGDFSSLQIETVEANARTIFGYTRGSDISQRMVAARQAIKDTHYELVLAEVKSPLNQHLTALEKHQLWKMLEEIATSDGPMTPEQNEMLSLTEKAFNLVVPNPRSL
jgi:uncharacterized tellurite resistance protein B-like protein